LSIIRRLAVATAVVFGISGFAQAQTPTPASNGTAITLPHPGQPIYRQYCAACHDKPEETKAPAKATLEAMSFQSISFALTQGKMQVQAAALDEEQRGQLIAYLTGATKRSMETWSQGMMCDSARRNVDLKAPATVATFGFNERNTRSLTAADAGLTKAQLAKLDLAWAIAFPDVTMIRAQGAVVGKTLFLPVAEAAAMYAFDLSDPAKPCVKWVYNTPNGAPLRSSPGYGVIADGRAVLAFSGLDATVHVVEAATGKSLWTKNVASYSYSTTTGTPRVLKGRIIVPVSQFEILSASDNRVPCCTNHGFLLSLEPATGAQQWRYDTMPDAKPIRDRGDGKMLLGPSGAPIWNSPVVDETRGLIFFGTGESNSPPAHPNTDALIAVRLADGKQVWSHQALANDIYNSGCGLNPAPEKLNCVKHPETVYLDYDFGASLILGKLKNGKDRVFAGQKSGTLWALEPDTGKVLFRRDIGGGATNGGIHWGIAFLDDTVYVPISVVGAQQPGGPPVDPGLKPGLYAIDANTGEIKWMFGVDPACGDGRDKKVNRCERHYGFSGAPTVIDGVVVTGSLDGHLYAIDGKTGKLVWKIDTVQPYQTINDVAGKGGSIDGASILGVNGVLVSGSGYGMFGQTPGNVLLGFRPRN
jgi:polyvinyl alcohol dehydrogenase (cytochrome)